MPVALNHRPAIKFPTAGRRQAPFLAAALFRGGRPGFMRSPPIASAIVVRSRTALADSATPANTRRISQVDSFLQSGQRR